MMSVQFDYCFQGYHLDTALRLLGPADQGDAEHRECCDHLAMLVQNIALVLFRVFNFLFGDHQWYNNRTAQHILQSYALSCHSTAEGQSPATDEALVLRLAALYDALSQRRDGSGSCVDGIERPVCLQNEHIEPLIVDLPLLPGGLENQGESPSSTNACTDSVEVFLNRPSSADSPEAFLNRDLATILEEIRQATDPDAAPIPQEVFERTMRAADQGDADALATLGYYFEVGYGTPPDFRMAFKYTKIAADKGSVKAQYKLGCYYFTGLGTDPSFLEALFYMKTAAENGFLEADGMLQLMTEEASTL